jgi:hypothetical protein
VSTGNEGRKGAGGDTVKFTGFAGIRAKAEQLVGPLKAAHKTPLRRCDVDRIAHMAGILVLMRCSACSLGERCDEHHPGTLLAALALEPDASPPDPVSEHQDLVDYYYQAFKAARGRAPILRPADTRAIKELRETKELGGVEGIKRLIDAAFGDPWGKRNADIRLINRNPSRWITSESQKRGGALQQERA